MAKTKTNDPDVQSIEQLTKRYRDLNDMQIRVQTNLENAQSNLASLQTEAVEKFGTSDVEELKAQLEKMEQENQRLQSEYQKHLDKIEADLAKVEDSFAAEPTGR